MRTTLTIDDDNAVALQRLREVRKVSLKGIVNEALREGLARMNEPVPRGEPYHTRSVSLGPCLVGSIDDVAEALAVAEGEGHR